MQFGGTLRVIVIFNAELYVIETFCYGSRYLELPQSWVQKLHITIVHFCSMLT